MNADQDEPTDLIDDPHRAAAETSLSGDVVFKGIFCEVPNGSSAVMQNASILATFFRRVSRDVYFISICKLKTSLVRHLK